MTDSIPTAGSITGADRAERIARDAHAGQTDKAGKPYIEHIERVVAILYRMFPDATEDEVCAAWLHDTIEDSEWDAGSLLNAGISKAAVKIVEEVTRPADATSYTAWIHSMSLRASLSALRVKIADNEDNSAPDRVAAIEGGQARLESRYLPARRLLEEGLRRGY